MAEDTYSSYNWTTRPFYYLLFSTTAPLGKLWDYHVTATLPACYLSHELTILEPSRGTGWFNSCLELISVRIPILEINK